ncbi:hypothetical protein ATANTOWER_004558 [Ataeniobius toweri]|uniref:Uncharacterized protein n=1 Tax=Ataeniobius toweri TaxID=208326 RepID=A0ABU7AY85_9TELE|nr:hypothetical protein [Ataeniobius toweri]
MLLRWNTEQKKESSIGTHRSHCLPHFLASRSFVHDPKFMPIDEGRNKDRPVNLFTTTDQHSVLITVAAAPSADLLLHSPSLEAGTPLQPERHPFPIENHSLCSIGII